jgi:hypothetical protein
MRTLAAIANGNRSSSNHPIWPHDSMAQKYQMSQVQVFPVVLTIGKANF